jgi:hypothetical protein
MSLLKDARAALAGDKLAALAWRRPRQFRPADPNDSPDLVAMSDGAGSIRRGSPAVAISFALHLAPTTSIGRWQLPTGGEREIPRAAGQFSPTTRGEQPAAQSGLRGGRSVSRQRMRPPERSDFWRRQ